MEPDKAGIVTTINIKPTIENIICSTDSREKFDNISEEVVLSETKNLDKGLAENHRIADIKKMTNSCEIKNEIGSLVPKVTDIGKMDSPCRNMYSAKIRIAIIAMSCFVII